MTLTGLAVRNLARNKFRVGLTVLAVAIAIVAFLLLRTVTWAWVAGPESAPKDRVVTRHKITLAMALPKRYVADVRGAPHIRAATWANWFGGKDPQHDTEVFATLAVDPATYFAVYDEMQVSPDQLQAFQHEDVYKRQVEYFRPLVVVFFAIDRLLYGLHPAGYHLTNLLLHAGTTLLVWGIGRRVLGHGFGACLLYTSGRPPRLQLVERDVALPCPRDDHDKEKGDGEKASTDSPHPLAHGFPLCLRNEGSLDARVVDLDVEPRENRIEAELESIHEEHVGGHRKEALVGHLARRDGHIAHPIDELGGEGFGDPVRRREERDEALPRVAHGEVLERAWRRGHHPRDAPSERRLVAREGGAVDTDGIGPAIANPLDAPVVEKHDPAVLLKYVVAGMRVGVEHPAHERSLEDEPPEGLCPGLALLLRGRARFFEGRSND